MQGPIVSRKSRVVNSLFGLKRVPGFEVERLNAWVHREVAREFAAHDKLNRVGFVLVPPIWTPRPTVQLECDQFFQRNDLELFGNRLWLRKRNFAAALQNSSRRQQINEHTVAPV